MNILYVEDDTFDVELTSRELSRAGRHFVESVGTIRAARELLNTSADHFDLLLTDLNLPDGSGVDLLGYVRGRGLPLAAVVVTGAGDEEMAVALLKAGAEDYLVKEGDYLQHLAPLLESALQRFRSERARRSHILNVIYADANAEDIELARLHLSRFAAHIRIYPVASVAEVYRQLETGCPPGGCDALVVDYNLPDANALDLLRNLNQMGGVSIPVLLVTGSGNEDVAVQALKLGAADYLVKTAGYIFRLPSAIENAVSNAQLAREQAALRESEARFRRLTENAPDIIFRLLLQPERRCEYVSPAALKMTGYAPEEFYADAELLERLAFPEDRAQGERIRAGGIRPRDPLLMRWVRKDGRVIWVELRVAYTYDAAGEISALEGIVRDVSGQRETEAEMQRQLRHLASLRSIDQAINNSFDLNLVLIVLVDKVTSELKVDAAAILLYNQVNQLLEPAAGVGFHRPPGEMLPTRIGEAYAGLAMYERRRIQFPAPDLPPASRNTAQLMVDEGFTCGVCTPLITKGEVKGVLQLFNRAALENDANWLGFLDVLSSQAAIAIDNAALFQQLQQSNQDLRQTYDAMLEGVVRAMEMRDREPSDHNRSVARLVLDLAERMHVDPERLSAIRRGALLHDIGTLAIPEKILAKPGPLDEEEWRVVREHPRAALEILAPIPSLGDVLDIPYAHHERWDGSGYPRGLAGERIPLAARLFAVVDVWDALTSDKPYRPAFSREEALAYIREQSGRHFDPQVVEVFLKALG